jgi:hypothetical protein
MAINSKHEVNKNEDGSTTLSITIFTPETVPCTWCGTPTTYTGTKHCDPCHELDKRISSSTELAARMVGFYSKQQNITKGRILDVVAAGRLRPNKEK